MEAIAIHIKLPHIVPLSLLPVAMDDHSHEHEHGATGHSHNLDPSVFETSAATDEPIGYIMALHITFMVLCMSFLLVFELA